MLTLALSRALHRFKYPTVGICLVVMPWPTSHAPHATCQAIFSTCSIYARPDAKFMVIVGCVITFKIKHNGISKHTVSSSIQEYVLTKVLFNQYDHVHMLGYCGLDRWPLYCNPGNCDLQIPEC